MREEAMIEADVVWLGYCQVQPQVDRPTGRPTANLPPLRPIGMGGVCFWIRHARMVARA